MKKIPKKNSWNTLPLYTQSDTRVKIQMRLHIRFGEIIFF